MVLVRSEKRVFYGNFSEKRKLSTSQMKNERYVRGYSEGENTRNKQNRLGYIKRCDIFG